MPKPLKGVGGSGMHINFSVLDQNGNNALTRDARVGPDHMSDLARNCVAGLVAHYCGQVWSLQRRLDTNGYNPRTCLDTGAAITAMCCPA